MAWLTPSEIDEPEHCFRLFLPYSMTHVLLGLFLEVSEVYNWEQFGDATPEECAALWLNVLNTFAECPPESELTMPIASIFPFAGATIPDGCLLCDGASYTSSEYPDLYAAIHANFKSGSNFNVPDLRAKFPVGVGTFAASGSVAMAGTGGADKHTLNIGELAAHKHPVNDDGTAEYHLHTTDPGSALARQAWPANPAGGWIKVNSETGSKGLGNAHNNLPPFQGVNYCIVAEVPT